MAQLKNAPIGETDLLDYLNSSAADFAFEMTVLRLLRSKDLVCEHSGHYEDPATGKSREFDIRASLTDEIMRVRLAVECKNLRENFPMLASCVRRQPPEAFHQFSLIRELPSQPGLSLFKPRVHEVKVERSQLYPPGDWVGKKIDQIGRDLKGVISTGDSEVFEKWGQALASAKDLVERIQDDPVRKREDNIGLSAVIPMVVVPDGRLWAVHYNDDGIVETGPHQVHRVPFYVGKEYTIHPRMSNVPLVLSHLEFVTETGLRQFLESFLTGGLEDIFPGSLVRSEVKRIDLKDQFS